MTNRSQMPALLETVEIETGPQPTGAVIWLHGLGADGHDFAPVVPDLAPAGARALRFVFPHAPVRPVSMAGGTRLRAWYDVSGLDRTAAQDEVGIRCSDAAIRELIGREQARGGASERIVLAGFSQGGAMALFTGTRLPQKLAGIIALSCYMPLASSFAAERQAANQATPIFMAHGAFDPVIELSMGEHSQALLGAAGYAVEWHRYRMAHEVCSQEIEAIAGFLQRVL